MMETVANNSWSELLGQPETDRHQLEFHKTHEDEEEDWWVQENEDGHLKDVAHESFKPGDHAVTQFNDDVKFMFDKKDPSEEISLREWFGDGNDTPPGFDSPETYFRERSHPFQVEYMEKMFPDFASPSNKFGKPMIEPKTVDQMEHPPTWDYRALRLECVVGCAAIAPVPIRNDDLHESLNVTVKLDANPVLLSGELTLDNGLMKKNIRIAPQSEVIFTVLYKPQQLHQSVASSSLIVLNMDGSIFHERDIIVSAIEEACVVPDRPVVNFGGISLSQETQDIVSLQNKVSTDVEVRLAVETIGEEERNNMPSDPEDLFLTFKEMSKAFTLSDAQNTLTLPGREEVIVQMKFKPHQIAHYNAKLVVFYRTKQENPHEEENFLSLSIPLQGYGGTARVQCLTKQLGFNETCFRKSTGWYETMCRLRNTGYRTAYIKAKQTTKMIDTIPSKFLTLAPGKECSMVVRCRESILENYVDNEPEVYFTWGDEVARKRRTEARKQRGVGLLASSAVNRTALDSFDDPTSISYLMKTQTPLPKFGRKRLIKPINNVPESETVFDEDLFEQTANTLAIPIIWDGTTPFHLLRPPTSYHTQDTAFQVIPGHLSFHRLQTASHFELRNPSMYSFRFTLSLFNEKKSGVCIHPNKGQVQPGGCQVIQVILPQNRQIREKICVMVTSSKRSYNEFRMVSICNDGELVYFRENKVEFRDGESKRFIDIANASYEEVFVRLRLAKKSEAGFRIRSKYKKLRIPPQSRFSVPILHQGEEDCDNKLFGFVNDDERRMIGPVSLSIKRKI